MRIGFALAEHRTSLIEALTELNGYYNEDIPPDRALVAAHLDENLLPVTSPTRLVVAAEGGEVFGLAAIAIVYSIVEPAPDKRKQLALKELFVRSAARGKRIGEAIMAWVANYARSQGCSRIDWNVKSSNAGGIAFYTALGARRVKDRLSYRLDREAIDALADHPIDRA